MNASTTLVYKISVLFMPLYVYDTVTSWLILRGCQANTFWKWCWRDSPSSTYSDLSFTPKSTPKHRSQGIATNFNAPTVVCGGLKSKSQHSAPHFINLNVQGLSWERQRRRSALTQLSPVASRDGRAGEHCHLARAEYLSHPWHWSCRGGGNYSEPHPSHQ
jgi:hypothetical protein